ncbi:Agamous-like MADS-box protein AGL80 [Acorus gramineus]|uniref:Agamous-like MADS-box protein AGL80 n=1 Tax=Acorus gramineus TaxID=55184 RepID=A0AAV9BS67_ACOGR|nr:Agamous-like MADS-box protein AGL80 [Acorus gramineus]
MVYITDDVTRRRTFAKRKRCLLKKVYELSVLCGVPACALVTAPGEPNNQPEIWPSIFDADNLIGRLRDLPASARDKHDLDQERFLSKEVERLREQLGRLEKGNREAEMKVAQMRYLVEGKDLAAPPVAGDDVHVELPVADEVAATDMCGAGGGIYDNKNDDWLYFSCDYNICDNLSSVFNDFGPLY